ncbi:MAG: N-acetylmuramoyl-L-alanine amidase [Gammaproteobacteria bacterium]|nr:N-acetylmuramoyl-L-alanine amidase [Gammaproteobacteria bacterium]
MSKDAIRSTQTGLITLRYDLGRSGAGGWFSADTEAETQAWLAAGGKAVTTSQAPASRPANGPVIRQGSAGHSVHEIIVHCSATHAGWMAGRPLAEKVAEIRNWRRAKGRRDIGYHWVIDRDGKLLADRPEAEIGAHTIGHNSETIGICLFDGYGSAETDPFFASYTTQQDITLHRVIDAIGSRTVIDRVIGHNQDAAKAWLRCP